MKWYNEDVHEDHFEIRKGEGMSIKINSQFTGFSGPSQDYYKATNRFNQILSQKLGQKSAVSKTVSVEKSTGQPIDVSDVTLKSHASANEIDEKLKGTDLEGLGQAFVNAENKTGVNAWFLTGLAAHESGFGTSRIAQDKNNLFGFMAYDRSPYKSAKTYGTKEDGIMDVADYLSQAYLSENGKYYNGKSIDAIGQKYATDPNWANAITSHLKKMLGDEVSDK